MLRKLRILNVMDTDIGDNDLSWCAEPDRRLAFLNIRNCILLTNAVCRKIAFTEELHIGGRTNINGGGVWRLKEVKRLYVWQRWMDRGEMDDGSQHSMLPFHTHGLDSLLELHLISSAVFYKFPFKFDSSAILFGLPPNLRLLDINLYFSRR